MSYRSYVPWARTYLTDKYNKNKPPSPTPQEQVKQDKNEKDKDKDKNSKESAGHSSRSRYGTTSSRTPDISSSSLNAYRPSNYRSSLTPSSYVTPRTRERSSSRDRYASTFLPKDTKPAAAESSTLTRPTYTRSNSTLSESDTAEKKSYTGYKRYGTSPSRTTSYAKAEEKSNPTTSFTPATPPRSDSSYRYATNPYTSRFLASTSDKAGEEGRYTYRTRPQPVLKKLEISIPKSPDITSPLSPLSPSSRSPLSSLSPKPPPSPKSATSSISQAKAEEESEAWNKNIPCTISVTTRATSPNPPTAYSRPRRSDIAREIQRDVARSRRKAEFVDKETQTDKAEESSRLRFGSRTTPWSYLDRLSGPYTPVSRYSSRYSETPRSSRSTDEPTKKSSPADKLKEGISNLVATLQSSSLNKRDSPPKRASPIKSDTTIKRISPPKGENKSTCKASSPPKIESKLSFTEKIKRSNSKTENRLKSKSPEKIVKSSSPEKIKSKSPDKTVKSSSPEKIFKSTSTVKILKSDSKNDIARPVNKTDNTKQSEKAKMPSKVSVVRRRSSKDESLEEGAVPPTSEIKSPDISSIIPKVDSKTEINVNNSNGKVSSLVKSTSKDITNKQTKSSKLSRESSVSPRSSPQKELTPSRVTSRRSVPREDPIVIEQTTMSPELIVGPMKVDAKSSGASSKDSSEGSPSVPKKPPPSPASNKSDKLPPPSPKLSTLKTSTSSNAITKVRLANKDYRKSPLNMGTTDVESSKHDNQRAISEGHSPLTPHKPLKSLSNNNIVNSSNNNKLTVDTGLPKISISKSSSPVKSDSSITNESSSDLSFKSSTGVDALNDVPTQQNKPRPNSQTKFIRQSSSSRNDSSSTSSSASESESEEESTEESEDEFKPQDDSGIDKVLKRHQLEVPHVRRSPGSTSEDVSSLPIDKLSKGSTDKPPLPPNARPKDENTNKAASFLMRALAPVTNLLWVKKSDSNEKTDEALKRSNTSQSISEIHDQSDLSSKTDDDLDNNNVNKKSLSRNKSRKSLKSKNRSSVDLSRALSDEDGKRAADMQLLDEPSKSLSKSTENLPVIKRDASNRSLRRRPSSCDINCWLNDGKSPAEVINSLDNAVATDAEEPVVQKIFTCPSGETWCINAEADISESSESSEESESEESEPKIEINEKPRFSFKRIESGERAWWLKSTDNVPEGITRMKSTTSLNKEQMQTEPEPKFKIRPQMSGELPWWLTDEVPEGIKREASCASIKREPSSTSVSKSQENIEKGKRYSLRHIESGEKAWWMESSESIPQNIQRDPSTPSVSVSTNEDEKEAVRYRIRPQQSGERAWWLQSTENIPEDIKHDPSSHSLSKSKSSSGRKLKRNESSDKPWWGQCQENVALNEGLRRNDSIKTSKATDGLKRSDSTRSTGTTPRRIRRIESGEKAWWMESTDNIPEGIKKLEPEPEAEETKPKFHKLRPQESGERPWWLDSNANIPEGITQLPTSSSESESSETESDSEDDVRETNSTVPKFPLEIGDRTSPDGLETNRNRRFSGRGSPYDNVGWLGAQDESAPVKKKKDCFIGTHTNIDDILGCSSEVSESTSAPVKNIAEKFQAEVPKSASSSEDEEEESEEEEKPVQVTPVRRRRRNNDEEQPTPSDTRRTEKLDDVALQLYKDGDYGSYLDLEASLSEQQEEFEDFHLNRKNSIVLRTQLSVRVHTIIEKLLNSEGRELRRALFSLKQIFQEDKDLVHEFVQNDGLACLIKVGSEADQNYQNYILRALGQVMLYVDGMNGVMAHNETVQWLYALISSRFRLVVKTALKLLLVFVEYKESNCMLLIKAIRAEDTAKNQASWCNVMKLLNDYDTSDTELLVYASSLINKTLNGVPDQDTYYDQVDSLEEQGIEGIIQRYMSRQGTDLDLLRQFQIYEAVLHHEDGEDKGTPLRQLDEAIRKTLRNRKSSTIDSTNERRKSRRHSSSLLTPPKNGLSNGNGPHLICTPIKLEDAEDSGSSSSRSSPSPSLSGDLRHLNGGCYADNNKANVGVTPALRRRRERAERQRSFIREQQESAAILRKSSSGDAAEESLEEKNNMKNSDSENRQPSTQPTSRTPSRQDILMNAVNCEMDAKDSGEDRKILQLNRENTVKDLTQKLANSMMTPNNEQMNRIGDMTGIISKAMEGLAKSKSKGDMKPTETKIIPEVKKSETEIQWDNLLENMSRPLQLCDLDFTDLHSDDEMDILAPNFVVNGVPPPPPPFSHMAPPPTPAMPPPPPVSRLSPPGAFGVNLKHHSSYSASPQDSPSQSERSIKKSKKTLKLFWKEVREDPATVSKLQKLGQNLIWDELSPVNVDTQKLEHLFESRAKDINPKTKQEMNKAKEIIVLDPKRSNAINIGMTKLPPPRAIKTAILKMDSTVMNREGIEKLFAMLPTEEERSRIQEAQVANPDIPLGSAEQFLLTMASITELPARLKLWAFKLDYENIEKEIAEPVMDLKQGMEILKSNKTFRCILGTLLSIGIFLNGNEVKGFQIEYLAKVPEVKDTVHKHSLLHHLCHMVMEKFPDSTDLYSEIGAITRASKVDFDELTNNIHRLESECKASWDYLKVIAKHDGSSATKNKMSEFLTDCAQRIIVLGIVHRRIMNRYHKFLLWLGTPPHRIQDTKPNEFCRILSEFALEYRTTRERVLQQLEKKANHRERNKTRGKMITEVGKFSRTKETDRADAELRQLLGGDMTETESLHGTWRRQRKDLGRMNSLLRDEGLSEQLTDGDDEILESLVKTATKTPVARTTPRERKRTRHADRKSLRRTLKNGLSEEEKKHLAAYIKGY